jgi:hypothetical protein
MTEEHPKGYRGKGIYVTGGGFRLRDFSLTFDRSTGDLVDTSMVPELRIDTFDHWLAIARRARDEATTARERGVAAPLDDDQEFGQALEQEYRATMVVVAASAFAVDAFFASVVQHAPDARVHAKGRDAEVFETLKRAFRLSAAQQTALREPLRVLYRLRDEAVHPPASWKEPLAHPIYGLGMEPRFVYFRAENAINAQALAQKLIHVCMRCPKPQHADLVEWCEAFRELVGEPEPVPAWADPSAAERSEGDEQR